MHQFPLVIMEPKSDRKGRMMVLLPIFDHDSMVAIGRQLVEGCGSARSPKIKVGVRLLQQMSKDLHLQSRQDQLVQIEDLFDHSVNVDDFQLQYALRYLATCIYRAEPDYLMSHITGSHIIVGITVRWCRETEMVLTLCRNPHQAEHVEPSHIMSCS